nr:relaxase/mobilization nuclease [Streptomyces sp. SID13666]
MVHHHRPPPARARRRRPGRPVIFQVHERTHTPHDPLTAALGRPISPDDGLTEHTVVACWPGLDSYTLDDEQATWTSAQWAQHLEDPLLEHPFAASPNDDRRAILHLEIRLHRDDRVLTGPQWAETAHRLARAAGIEIPGDEHGCQWIAVQAQPGRLDLIANLIRLDGTWNTQPANVLQRLSVEGRRIEGDLRLTPAPTATQPQAPAPVPTATGHLASVLSQLADEHAGPLATVRSLIEHTAHRIARQPGATRPDTAHRLELIARRLHAIQQDLDTTAAHLSVVRPSVAPAPPAVRSATHRSP